MSEKAKEETAKNKKKTDMFVALRQDIKRRIGRNKSSGSIKMDKIIEE